MTSGVALVQRDSQRQVSHNIRSVHVGLCLTACIKVAPGADQDDGMVTPRQRSRESLASPSQVSLVMPLRMSSSHAQAAPSEQSGQVQGGGDKKDRSISPAPNGEVQLQQMRTHSWPFLSEQR